MNKLPTPVERWLAQQHQLFIVQPRPRGRLTRWWLTPQQRSRILRELLLPVSPIRR